MGQELGKEASEKCGSLRVRKRAATNSSCQNSLNQHVYTVNGTVPS
eukprot:gene11022-3092_t